MADIQEFVTQAAQGLGASEEQIRAATGGALGFLKDQVDGGDFQSLLTAIPGASDLLPASGSSSGSGLVGGLTKLAGSALGGKLGDAAGLLGTLQKAGLSADHVDDFLGMFVKFLKNNVDADLVGRVLSQLKGLNVA